MSEVQKQLKELQWLSAEDLEKGVATAGEKPAEVVKALQEDTATQKILGNIRTLKDLPKTMLVGQTMWLVKWAYSALEGTKNLLVGTGEFIGVWVAKLVHEWADSALQYANEKTQGIRDIVNVAGEAIAVTAFEAVNGDRSVIMGAVRYWKEQGVEIAKLPPEKQVELMASLQSQIAMGVMGSKGLGAASKTATLSSEINVGGKVLEKTVSMGAKVGTEAVGLDSGALKHADVPDISMVSNKPAWTIADNIDHGVPANADTIRDHTFIDSKDVPENMQGSQWYVDQQGHLLINMEEWNKMSFTEKKNFVTHERTHQMMLRQGTQQMQALVQDFTSHPQWKWLQQEGKSLMGKNAGNATDADIVNELVAHRMWDRRVGEVSGMSEAIDSVLWKHPEFTTSIRQLKEQIAKDPVNEALELRAAARTNMVSNQMKTSQDSDLLQRPDPQLSGNLRNTGYIATLKRIVDELPSKVEDAIIQSSTERSALLKEAGSESLTREGFESVKERLQEQTRFVGEKFADVHQLNQRINEPGAHFPEETKKKLFLAQGQLINELDRVKSSLEWPEMTAAKQKIDRVTTATKESPTRTPGTNEPIQSGAPTTESRPSYEERLKHNSRENYAFEQLSPEDKTSVLLNDMKFQLSEYNADRFFNVTFPELDATIQGRFTPDIMARFGRDSNGILLPEKGSLADKTAKAEARSGVSHETVLHNASLQPAERLSLAEQLVEKELKQEQKDTILRLHNDVSKGVYQNGHAELRTMVEELDKAGILREKTRELMENGVLGSAPDSMTPVDDFQALLQRDSNFQHHGPTMVEWENPFEQAAKNHLERIGTVKMRLDLISKNVVEYQEKLLSLIDQVEKWRHELPRTILFSSTYLDLNKQLHTIRQEWQTLQPLYTQSLRDRQVLQQELNTLDTSPKSAQKAVDGMIQQVDWHSDNMTKLSQQLDRAQNVLQDKYDAHNMSIMQPKSKLPDLSGWSDFDRLIWKSNTATETDFDRLLQTDARISGVPSFEAMTQDWDIVLSRNAELPFDPKITETQTSVSIPQ